MPSHTPPHLPPPPDPTPAVAPLSELTLTVFRLHGALLAWGDHLVAPLGLTSARWQMLGAIAIAGKTLSAPQAAEAMGVTRQGAQKQLNLLLEQGLVAAQPNPAHRRSPLYSLTARGHQLYAQAEQLWAAQAATLTAELSTDQVGTSTTVLSTILRQLTLPSPSTKESP